MPIISSSQSNSYSTNSPYMKAWKPKEHFLNPDEVTVSMHTENQDHISRCCVSHWHEHVVKTPPAINDGWSDSPDMSPAPLRIPADKTPHPPTEELQTPLLDYSSEYSFPLPPASLAKFRSRLPPPYSSLVPPTSTPPMKDHVSTKSTSGAVKKSLHTIRRTQSSTDIEKFTKCKPLPAQPPVEINEKEREELRTLKPGNFKLTPVSAGHSSRGANSHSHTGPMVNAYSGERVPLQTANSPREPVLGISVTRNDTQLQEAADEKARKEGGRSMNYRNNTDNSRDESNTSKRKAGTEVCNRESQRLTSEQILWLHRNYRGEATFLKAWGLHITRDSDRERGLEIMRELMAAEIPKEKEEVVKQGRQQKQRDQQGRLQFKAPPTRDKEALHAIEEEKNSHEYLYSGKRSSS
ncbi:hypothetical protein K449DRAFT_435070 [Hypoxylon sp. EC38]|nr:hypothetical protein K449DRAFT_435070 [Hypoxylon sp. EC38]